MLRLAFAILLVGTPAIAGCPDRPGRGEAIVLTRDRPFFSVVLSPEGAGLRERRIMERGGAVQPVSSRYPHPLVAGERISRNGLIRLSYTQDPRRIDALPTAGVWQSDVTLRIDGAPAGTGRSTLSFLGEEDIVVGTCRYRVWVVEDRLQLDGHPLILARRYYSPALRAVLRSVSYAPDGNPTSEVRFDSITSASAS